MKGDIMTVAVAKERVIVMRGRDRDFTQEEYDRINDEYRAAEARGDEAEAARLLKLIPMNPTVVKAFAKIYGRDSILEADYDLTEANLAFGEGWIYGDEYE